MNGKVFVVAALLLMTAAAACSQTTMAAPTGANTASASNTASGAPEAVVNAFAAALRAGDSRAVQQLMAPDVIIAESGGVERSFAEYAGEHLQADIAFSAAVQFTLKQRDVIATADAATVISRSEVTGQYEGRSIHSQSMETMELRRISGQWRIVHIHWSSSPIRDAH